MDPFSTAMATTVRRLISSVDIWALPKCRKDIKNPNIRAKPSKPIKPNTGYHDEGNDHLDYVCNRFPRPTGDATALFKHSIIGYTIIQPVSNHHISIMQP